MKSTIKKLKKNTPRNLFIKVIPLLISCLIFANFAFGLNGLPCYSIGKQSGQYDKLFEYSVNDQLWKNLGNTGTYNIESVAINNEIAKIYAVDGGTFGTINPVTAEFKSIKNLESANGVLGNITMDDICGLTYNSDDDILMAVHRIDENTNLLIKINPFDGAIIKNGFFDTNGNPVDYARIESVENGNSRVVADIGYNAALNELYTVYNNNGRGKLYKTSQVDGSAEEFIKEIFGEIGGFGFNASGNFIATTLSNPSNPSNLVSINFDNFMFFDFGMINDQSVNFVCIACAEKVQIIKSCEEEDVINITNYSPDKIEYSASEAINSNEIISSNVNYLAKRSITLSPYFEVMSSSDFYAGIITNCQ